MSETMRTPIKDVAIVGDVAFSDAIKKHLAAKDHPAPPAEIPAGAPTITVDAKGNIIGDTSDIDPNILSQLQTPESQKQIADLYRQSRYAPEPPRPPQYIAEAGGGRSPRDLRAHQPLPGREGRRLLRQYLRKRTKIERQGAKENHPHGG